MRSALITACFLVASLGTGAFAQSGAPARAMPENGFVSRSQYTNAFFGFSLPLPEDPTLTEAQLSFKRDTPSHFLFGLKCEKVTDGFFNAHAKVTVFYVNAEAISNASPEDARKVALRGDGNLTNIKIGGKEFWKRESEEKVPEGKMWSTVFTTALNGYVLQFEIESFDKKLTEQLQRCIDKITFFDPAKAEEVAGTASRPYNPAANVAQTSFVPSNSRVGQLDPGVFSGNTYTNDALGLRYQFPAEWIIENKATVDKKIEAGHQFAFGDDPAAAQEHEATWQCARVLLSVTKDASGTAVEEVNPTIEVIAIDSACFPGSHFPTSADDHNAILDTARQFSESLGGEVFSRESQSSTSGFVIQGHLFLSISGSMSATPMGRTVPVKNFVSLDVTQAGDYWVAWMFISGSQAGLSEIKNNTRIAFRLQATAAGP
jgi:hypothetical protein